MHFDEIEKKFIMFYKIFLQEKMSNHKVQKIVGR